MACEPQRRQPMLVAATAPMLCCCWAGSRQSYGFCCCSCQPARLAALHAHLVVAPGSGGASASAGRTCTQHHDSVSALDTRANSWLACMCHSAPMQLCMAPYHPSIGIHSSARVVRSPPGLKCPPENNDLPGEVPDPAGQQTYNIHAPTRTSAIIHCTLHVLQTA